MSRSLSTWARFCIVLVLAAIIIAGRRWFQFVHPDVWVEDGTLVIPSYVEHGWFGLFTPVAGYLIIPAKLVSFIALSITFVHYAFVSTVLATIVQASCVAAIASAPTMLPARIVCAFAVVFLPSGTEVFGLPVYTFWWTTLMLFVALLWNSDGYFGTRVALLAVGALSSPFVIAMVPIFAVRAAVERRRSDIIVCVWAVVFAVIQAYYVMRENAASGNLITSLLNIKVLISKYFGTALFSLSIHGAGAFGFLLISFLLLGFFTMTRKDRLAYFLLGLCLGAAIVSSVARVPVTAPHPLLAGPRYFFFPLIITIWMLIWIAFRSRRSWAVVSSTFLGAYIPSLAVDFFFAQQVAKQPWSQQVQTCMTSESYTFDIQYGLPFIHWQTTLSGQDCRRLASSALFE